MTSASRTTLRILVAVCFVQLLSSCAAVNGNPARSGNTAKRLRQLDQYYAADILAKYLKSPDRRAFRDDVINGQLLAMDIHFDEFVQSLAEQGIFLNVGSDFAVLGLSGAGTVLPSAGTKSVLAAISGGITGAKTSVDKNVFYEKTMPALLAQMQAERKTVLAMIRTGQQQDVAHYPLSQALLDLNSYYLAGTIPGAISGIIDEAGSKSTTAEIEIKRDQEFVANEPKASDNVDRIKKLTPEQALTVAKAMEPHVTDRNKDIQAAIQAWDPNKSRLSDGKFAKQLLLRWAAIDSRDSQSLEEWQGSLDSVEK